MDFWSPVPVTVQVLIRYTSAGPSKGTLSYPNRSKASRMASVSYWFTLQPSVRHAIVFMDSPNLC